MALITILAMSTSMGSEVAPRPWDDSFYQYRIPIEIEVEKPGWVVVPVDEKMITASVNRIEELKYPDKSFAYNYVKCVETDEAGNATGTDIEAGFYLIETGSDRATGWNAGYTPTNNVIPLFEENGILPPARKGDELTVSAVPGGYHLLRYITSGGGSPAYKYEPIFPEGSRMHRYFSRISYEPRLLQLAETTHEVLMQPEDGNVSLVIGGRFVNTPKSLSFRTAKILFLANVKTPGIKHWHIYYQPMGAHFLMVPERRHEAVPDLTVELRSLGMAEKQEGLTRYALAETPRAALWFAESTVKLTPRTPAPAARADAVRIACARNERRSFQIVTTPRRAVRVAGVTADDLRMGSETITSDRITVLAVDYVPIRKTSHITPVVYTGWIGDPLTDVTSKLLTPESGNQAYWITLDIPAGAAPGVYNGRITIHGEDADNPLFKVPMELTVYDFALPEFSPLQCNMGGQFFVKPCGPTAGMNMDRPRLADHYGVRAREDLQKLADLHYEVMVRNKFTPKNVALYTPIGMKWDPPPDGFNVDTANNFFRLYDWDFTEFNAKMAHYVNNLKLNQICIYHNNPIALNLFMHLPGGELDRYPDSSPFVTYAWQSFRDMTIVGYDIKDNHSYRKIAKDITRDQYDRLILDFFGAIARNLEKNGWLDIATIMIDETHNDVQLKHFLRLLKSDPLLSRIKVGVCIQGLTYFTDPEYNGLLDYYIPQLDENYNRWESFYFTDYGIEHDRAKVWNYVVNSARFAIDAPGINNRQIGLDLWKRGAGGYLCWDTFIYIHGYGDNAGSSGHSGNPWLDPYTRLGNGALSFFYPPRQDGVFSESPNFTITPSLRMEMHREGVNDYEYAWLLEQSMMKAEKAGRDVSEAKAIFADIERFWHNPNLWSQNDAWFLELRRRMAEQIVRIKIGE